MAVIAKRQRLGEVVRQRLEPAEVPRPGVVIELQAYTFGPALVYEARLAFGERRRLDSVVEVRPQRQDLRIRPVG